MGSYEQDRADETWPQSSGRLQTAHQGMQRIRENNTRIEMSTVLSSRANKRRAHLNLGVIYMGELRKVCAGSDLEMVHEGMTEFKLKESQAQSILASQHNEEQRIHVGTNIGLQPGFALSNQTYFRK